MTGKESIENHTDNRPVLGQLQRKLASHWHSSKGLTAGSAEARLPMKIPSRSQAFQCLIITWRVRGIRPIISHELPHTSVGRNPPVDHPLHSWLLQLFLQIRSSRGAKLLKPMLTDCTFLTLTWLSSLLRYTTIITKALKVCSTDCEDGFALLGYEHNAESALPTYAPTVCDVSCK